VGGMDEFKNNLIFYFSFIYDIPSAELVHLL
jgi:hypothetical protein